MTLGQKIRHLRLVEGQLRNLHRPMTQAEVVRAVKRELGRSISQAYLSQLEAGVRPHLTQTSRTLLADFFKVHPAYLMDDPEGYRPELTSLLGASESSLDSWLYAGAERMAKDPEIRRALVALADYRDTRKALMVLREVLQFPGLLDQLAGVLRGGEGVHTAPPARRKSGSRPSRKELP